jgi:spore coat protein U-like protein
MRPAALLLSFGSLMLAVLVPVGAARAESCTVSATSVAFGTYDPLAGAALDTTGTVSVTCTSAIPPRVDYDILLNPGQSASYGPRAMTNGTSQLNYNLYTDPTRTQVWGDGSGATSVISARYNVTRPGSTETRDYTVYGRAFAGQNVTTGVYLDNITVTVNF